MAIEAAFTRFTETLASLREALQALSLTTREDGPSPQALFLVQKLGDLVDDLRGWTEESHSAALAALQGVAHPPNLHQTRRSLDEAGDRLMVVRNDLFDKLLCYEILDALTRFGRQRNGEWLGWTSSVIQAIGASREALRVADRALLLTWAEFSERLGTRSVSLQTTHIGQQIIPASMSTGIPGAQRGSEDFT